MFFSLRGSLVNVFVESDQVEAITRATGPRYLEIGRVDSDPINIWDFPIELSRFLDLCENGFERHHKKNNNNKTKDFTKSMS